ncbi:hypothetical protein [Streptomyces sp. NBC_01689]|uniref:hypothetical protein n=1 Tax=Streptomyces sp. NBC_01689 TaxID=2975911 RepID=UPI002E380C41|nr:hypothetical protein [Streptomyces sp. NBC_01689]
MYEPTITEQLPTVVQAPTVYQPQHLAPAAYVHPAFPVPAADPRRALVQIEDTGEWVLARVPAAPPVLVPAAPDAAPRRPLSALERGAIIVVSSICAVTLSVGGALAMAGPYLADIASLLLGTAAVIGAATLGWAGLRIFGGTSSAHGQGTAAPSASPMEVNITGHGGQGGRWGSRGGTGVRIDKLTINGR